jgi:MFS-type transporter involved in bile tolerance (Atg22 family)
MPDFWENVIRFPRFFISATLGLIFTIIGPFLNLLRRPQTTIVFIIVLISIIIFISLTLKAMLNLDT